MHFFRKGQEKTTGMVTELKIVVSEGKKYIWGMHNSLQRNGSFSTKFPGGDGRQGRAELQQGRSWLDVPDLFYSWGKHSGRG